MLVWRDCWAERWRPRPAPSSDRHADRIEGFRLTVFGLVLIGVGAAMFWQAQWLLLLALGIGFVEILESSALIAVWKRNEG